MPILRTYAGFYNDKTFMGEENVVGEIMRSRQVLWTQWKDFNRVPKKLNNEQYICVVKGKEIFKMASPIYRKNIYVGAYNSLWKSDCPIDFFTYDSKKHKLADPGLFLNVTLNAGDCMYVPAFYYMQSKTLHTADNQESMIVTHEYAPHS